MPLSTTLSLSLSSGGLVGSLPNDNQGSDISEVCHVAAAASFPPVGVATPPVCEEVAPLATLKPSLTPATSYALNRHRNGCLNATTAPRWP